MATQEEALRTLVAAYGALVQAADADLANASTRAQEAAAREVRALASANLLLYARQLLPGARAGVVVQSGDTIFSLAQRYLGSALQYRALLAQNARRGAALSPGEVLQLPTLGGA